MKKKSLFALPVLFCLCAFTNPDAGYSIDFPKGWSEPFEAGNSMQSQSPGDAHLGWCRVNSNSLETLKDAKQAELNDQYAEPMGADVWAGMLGLDPAKLSFADGKAHVVDGAIVQETTVTLAPGLAGDKEARARIASWILPGRVLNAACFAETPDFAGFEPEFRRVVGSLRPR